MNLRSFLLGFLLFPASFGLTDNSPLKMLFIGNSLTYGNSLPAMLEQMVNESYSSKKLQVDMVTIGGATLKKHWFEGRAKAAIEQGEWDYVVLQEYSTLGSTLVNGSSRISDPETFHMFVKLFDRVIQRNGGKTLLFLTWANEDKTPDQALLNKAYVDIATDIGATVIPVGPVWQQVRKLLPNIGLYLDDNLHPSTFGTYVAASVFYAHLFGEKLVGVSGAIRSHSFDRRGITRSKDRKLLVDIPGHQAQVIQSLAMKSTKGMPAFIKQVQDSATRDLEPPTLPLPEDDTEFTEGEWVGELLFYRDSPATMSLQIRQLKGQWYADQTIRLHNGNRIKARHSLWLSDGKISWMDVTSNSYFLGVYRGDSIIGEARGLGADYLQPGGRFGTWKLTKAATEK